MPEFARTGARSQPADHRERPGCGTL